MALRDFLTFLKRGEFPHSIAFSMFVDFFWLGYVAAFHSSGEKKDAG